MHTHTHCDHENSAPWAHARTRSSKHLLVGILFKATVLYVSTMQEVTHFSMGI